MRASTLRNFRLTYADQNEVFAAVLPQDGTILRLVHSADGAEWALFRLRETIKYNHKHYEFLLLKSRRGGKIDDFYPTPVFIFLVEGPEKVTDGLDPKNFHQVAWGDILRW